MNFNFDKELKQYQAIVALKKKNRAFVDRVVLFNQRALTICGAIHAKMMLLLPEDQEKFKSENKGFFEGFAWMYYISWRKDRAKSCAHLLDMYRLLNVKLGIHEFRGETFYAGIPMVTAEEIEWACEDCQVDNNTISISPGHKDFSHEKVGIDGQLHKTDKYGEFESRVSNDDIYSDGSMVSFAELKAACKENVEPELACLSCVHQDGDGIACVNIDDFSCHKGGE